MFQMTLGNLKHSTCDSIWRLEPCAELRYLRSMRRSDLYACLPAGTEAVAVESGHGGETMEKELSKEPYVTPEVTSEEVAPGALASIGSPINGDDGVNGGGCGCNDIP